MNIESKVVANETIGRKLIFVLDDVYDYDLPS